MPQPCLEERVEPALGGTLSGFEQLLGAVPDPVLLEPVRLAHELDQALLVWLLPLEVHLVPFGDFRILEKSPGLGIHPVFGHSVFLGVDVFENLFDGLVLLNQLDGVLGTDPSAKRSQHT